MNKKQCSNVNSTKVNKEVLIVYENQMNDRYKKDEKKIKHIVSNNVMTTDHNKRMQIIMYYRNCKLKYLILKNNITRKNHKLAILYTSYL